MYRGPVISILKKKRGIKDTYIIAEDNDPTGYKSTLGVEAKAEVNIHAIRWPRYSPDLMPLEFSLWESINAAMDKCAPQNESRRMLFRSDFVELLFVYLLAWCAKRSKL